MKYLIEIPNEIEQALEQRAAASGEDVEELIRMAVVSFVRRDALVSPSHRRPDPPVVAAETVVPCDLPRSVPRLVPVDQTSRRRPDPITDSA